MKIGCLSWTRTNDQAVNSRLLYQLSYQAPKLDEGAKIRQTCALGQGWCTKICDK